MRMRINTTWHDIASASINRLRSGRRFETCANRSDQAIANKNVGALRMVVVDDGAAAYETCHLYFQVLARILTLLLHKITPVAP